MTIDSIVEPMIGMLSKDAGDVLYPLLIMGGVGFLAMAAGVMEYKERMQYPWNRTNEEPQYDAHVRARELYQKL